MVKVAVVGAGGYAGQELVNLLCRHPSVRCIDSFSSRKYRLPINKADVEQTIYPIESLKDKKPVFDILFMATPVEVSKAYLDYALARSDTVIDLSGYLRVPFELFETFYQSEHNHVKELSNSLYGLQPFCQSSFESQTLIANPGCYPTAILLSMLPLVNNKLITHEPVIIDARSGTSGAGKKANETLMFSEVAGNFFPYKIGKHQHMAELKHVLSSFAKQSFSPVFVTHIIPVDRGISVSIYLNLMNGVTAEEIERAYHVHYADYPLVQFGQINEEDDYFLQLKHVIHTPDAHINYKILDLTTLYINTNIDNLLKGAASQAIENMNMVLSLPVETGLGE